MARNDYSVPGLERGLRLLQLFDRDHARLGAPEMARRLEVPRSTVFRLTQTLERLGFLERVGNEFRLGAAVLRLGFEYLASLEITELARPFVEGLRDRTGFAAQLAVRDAREVVIVVRANPPSVFASNVNVGTRMPAHATVIGRMFLMDLDTRALAALYPEAKLHGHSPSTPKTRAELARLLAEDRARGFAVSEAFFERSISAVAAPVRDATGRVAAVLSISVLQPRIEPRALKERLVAQVRATAAELSARLNYRPVQAA